MKLVSILLFSLCALGCGADPPKQTQRSSFGSVFSPPSIAALMPSSTPVNSVAFTMTVNGANFTTDALVVWNGVPQRTIFVSSSQLLVAITDVDLMFAGLAHVSVRSGGMNSNTLDFNVAPQ